MNVVATAVTDIPPVGHAEAMELAAAEYGRFTSLLSDLAAGEWSLPTACDRWDVRQMVAHVLGAAEANASIRENAHQMRRGRRVQRQLGLSHVVHGVNEVQVEERNDLGPAQLLDRWRVAVPRALKGRRRFPAPLRPLRIRFEDPLGRRSLAYLMDLVYTRDVWMHRVDIARATGRVPELTADHDGRLVADMVADWARTNRCEFTLALTGPAGGAFRSAGEGGEHVEIDAVEWAWTVSGRAAGSGLLANPLPL